MICKGNKTKAVILTTDLHDHFWKYNYLVEQHGATP